MTLIALGFCFLMYLAIFVQWRDGCSSWEALILFPLGATLGVFYSTQFIGMSASLPRSRQTACFGAYFLYQQLGFVSGPAAGLALVQAVFGQSLETNLLDSPRKELVRCHNFFSARLTTCRLFRRSSTILDTPGNYLSPCKTLSGPAIFTPFNLRRVSSLQVPWPWLTSQVLSAVFVLLALVTCVMLKEQRLS